MARPTAALAAELVQCDKRIPWLRVLRGHNHVSPAMQINSEVDTLGPELLEFVLESAPGSAGKQAGAGI